MRRLACLLLTLVVLIAQSGGLQVAAWVAMAWEARSVEAVLAPPCTVCQAAKALQDGGTEGTPALKSAVKVDAVLPGALPWEVDLPAVTAQVWMIPDGRGTAQWSVVPDVPPPCVG